jgi:hypothetical protein
MEELNSNYPKNLYLLAHLGAISASTKERRCDESIAYFKRARALDKYLTCGMDLYSSVLQLKGDVRELGALASDLVSIHRPPSGQDGVGKLISTAAQCSLYCSEAWTAAAMHAEAKGDAEKAMDYIEKV